MIISTPRPSGLSEFIKLRVLFYNTASSIHVLPLFGSESPSVG